MSKPEHYLDIRIVFRKVTDEYDPEDTYFEPVESYPRKSTVPFDELYGVAESWAQMDRYQLLSPELIIDALSGKGTDLTR